MDRVKVHQTDPVQTIDLLELLQQLCQPDFAVEIQAVVGGVLSHQHQLADPVTNQLLCLPHHLLDRFRDMLASHLRDRTKGASPVATLGNLQVSKMTRRDPQSATILLSSNRCRTEQLALLACMSHKVIRHTMDLVSTKYPHHMIDLGTFLEQTATDTFGQAPGNDQAARLTRSLQVNHLVDHRPRLRSCTLDETARVNYHEIGTGRFGNQGVAVQRQCPQHLLAVDKVLGATQAHEGVTPLRLASTLLGHVANLHSTDGQSPIRLTHKNTTMQHRMSRPEYEVV